MRREVEDAVAEDGWTKSALQKMRKVDSFLKESQRLNSLGSCECVLSRSRDHTYLTLPSGDKSKNTQGLDTL